MQCFVHTIPFYAVQLETSSFAYLPEAYKLKAPDCTQKAQGPGWGICKSEIRDASPQDGHKGKADFSIELLHFESIKAKDWCVAQSGWHACD